MEPPFDPIAPLREALAVSPENLTLRRYLADQLRELERFEEAEAQYRELLARMPDDDGVRLALAQAYLGQGKTGHADILVELVTGREQPPVQAFVLLAQIRIAERDFRGARMAFRSACDLEPSLEISEVASELGVGPSNPFELEEDLADLDLGLDVTEDGQEGEALGTQGTDPLGLVPFQPFAAPTRPRETLSSAAGFGPEKSRLSLLLTAPLLQPDIFSAYGRSVGGGTLLMGPPGSGKSQLLRSVVGESDMHIVSLDVREVVAWQAEEGPSGFEAHFERFFEAAHRAAPCVVVFEHLDALQGLGSPWDPTAAVSAPAMLVRCLLDEFGAQRHAQRGVAFAATVQRPWALEPLLVRPGRFDRGVILPLPEDRDRRQIIESLLAGKPCASIDLKRITRKTAGRRVSELIEIVDVATESALERALQSGEPAPIREKALLAAIRSVRGTASAWYDELRARCSESSSVSEVTASDGAEDSSSSELQQVLGKALRAHDRRG